MRSSLFERCCFFCGRPVPGVVSEAGADGARCCLSLVTRSQEPPAGGQGGTCQESLDTNILMVSDQHQGPDAKLDNKPHYLYNGSSSQAIIREPGRRIPSISAAICGAGATCW